MCVRAYTRMRERAYGRWFTMSSMSVQPSDETEFGGTGGAPFPASTGYVPKDWENHTRMLRTDPADETSGADIVSQRSA